jgi:hypothetical protein
MKKQNANNKLAFNKAAVTELNDNQLKYIDGGSDTIRQILISFIVKEGYGSWLMVL